MPCVYALVSSNALDDIRYVGVSKYDTPSQRLQSHLINAKNLKRGTGHVHNWIRSVLAENETVVAITLKTDLMYEKALTLEIAYIAGFRKQGYDLTNLTDGGDGSLGLKHTDAAKEKNRITSTGRHHSAKSLKQRSISMKAYRKKNPFSAETREKISAIKAARRREKLALENSICNDLMNGAE